MTVKEIIKQYLEQNGYDGLCRDGCSCALEDLMPCEDMPLLECKPGYCIKCDHECDDEYLFCLSAKPNGKCPLADALGGAT